MKNKYEVYGDTAALYINSRKWGLVATFFDASDLEKVKQINGPWALIQGATKKKLYVSGPDEIKGGSKRVFLHRFLFGDEIPDGYVIDHINGNGLDNRRENLRIITRAANAQNRSVASSTSKTQIRGVSWHKSSSMWVATVRLEGQIVFNKLFKNIEDAEREVKKARARYLPFSKEGYDERNKTNIG